MRKPVVGEVLYATYVNFNRFKESETTGKEVVVSKVGRKYFYVDGIGRDVRFKIDTWSEEDVWNSRWEVWESKKEYDNYLQLQELLRYFKKTFDGYRHLNINLDQAILIKKILENQEVM